MAVLPKLLVSLDGIQTKVDSLDDEVKKMRAAVESMGGDVGEMQGSLERVEPHLEDVSQGRASAATDQRPTRARARRAQVSLRGALAGVLCAFAVVAGASCGEKDEPDRATPVPVAGETDGPVAEAAEILAAVRESRGRVRNRAAAGVEGQRRRGRIDGPFVRQAGRADDRRPIAPPTALTVGVDEYAERARARPARLPRRDRAVDGAAVRPQLRGRRGGERPRRERDRSRAGHLGDRPRREGVATFTAVIAANAKPSAEESRELAERVVETLRTRPPGSSQAPTGS